MGAQKEIRDFTGLLWQDCFGTTTSGPGIRDPNDTGAGQTKIGLERGDLGNTVPGHPEIAVLSYWHGREMRRSDLGNTAQVQITRY
jgi:hypothetical protein